MRHHWETEVSGRTLAEIVEAAEAVIDGFFGSPELTGYDLHIRPDTVIDIGGMGGVVLHVPTYRATVTATWQ